MSAILTFTRTVGAAVPARIVREKKQTTRMLKVVCPDEECPHNDAGSPYLVRTTRKWIECGLPACPCGAAMVLDPS